MRVTAPPLYCSSSDMLQVLSAELQSSIRSGVTVPTLCQCVEELVLNSLDAEATCIAVRVNVCEGFIQVVDNGHGLTQPQLLVIGERYAFCL